MIPDQTVEVTISCQGKYFASLGYGYVKQGTILEVDWKDLPKNSNKAIIVHCDECGSSFERSLQMLNRQPDHKCYSCARKKVGSKNKGNQWGNVFKPGEEHPRWNPNKDKYEKYRSEVVRITRQQDLTILENYDKPRGLCGVEGAYQLDHIISIKYGFDNNISPDIIGNVNNLQFITWQENRAKWYA